ncbi:MAG: hypothetical protein AAF449_21215, partial [Myxococcota bacterium]
MLSAAACGKLASDTTKSGGSHLAFGESHSGRLSAGVRFVLPPGPQWIFVRGAQVDIRLRVDSGASETYVDHRWTAPEFVFVDGGSATLHVQAAHVSTSSSSFEILVRRAQPGAGALYAELEEAVTAGRAPDAIVRAEGVGQLIAVAARLEADGEIRLAAFARVEAAIA